MFRCKNKFTFVKKKTYICLGNFTLKTRPETRVRKTPRPIKKFEKFDKEIEKILQKTHRHQYNVFDRENNETHVLFFVYINNYILYIYMHLAPGIFFFIFIFVTKLHSCSCNKILYQTFV